MDHTSVESTTFRIALFVRRFMFRDILRKQTLTLESSQCKLFQTGTKSTLNSRYKEYLHRSTFHSASRSRKEHEEWSLLITRFRLLRFDLFVLFSSFTFSPLLEWSSSSSSSCFILLPLWTSNVETLRHRVFNTTSTHWQMAEESLYPTASHSSYRGVSCSAWAMTAACV